MAEEKQLGLCDPPRPIYLTVGEGGPGWSRFEGDNLVPVEKSALLGYIVGLKLVPKIVRSEEKLKLDITVKADRTYIIRAGADTIFARGFLLTLNELDDSTLANPVYITVKPGGGDSKVVFCNIYLESGEQHIAKWDDDVKLFPIVQALQKRLGQEPQHVADLKYKGDRR